MCACEGGDGYARPCHSATRPASSCAEWRSHPVSAWAGGGIGGRAVSTQPRDSPNAGKTHLALREPPRAELVPRLVLNHFDGQARRERLHTE